MSRIYTKHFIQYQVYCNDCLPEIAGSLRAKGHDHLAVERIGSGRDEAVDRARTIGGTPEPARVSLIQLN